MCELVLFHNQMKSFLFLVHKSSSHKCKSNRFFSISVVKPIGDGAHIYLAQRTRQKKKRNNNELAHFEERVTHREGAKEQKNEIK